MRAVLCERLGGPDDLVLAEIDRPVPGPGEVLVAVAAAALNFFDTLIIQGKYQFQPELPFSPGAEFAGTVEAVGEGVELFEPGDRVMGYVRWGAVREAVVASEDELVPLPDGVPEDIAAGLSVTYGTTLHAFRDRARLEPGETVAVLGASGGVGLAAVEIAKAMGARVIACASSLDKLALARERGADLLVNYDREDLKLRLKELTHGEGVDVVYDPVGGRYAEQALRATGWRGRYLVVGFAAGDIPRMPLNLVMLKGCDVLGIFWGEAILREPEGHRDGMAQLLDWVAAGRIVPHVDGVYPIEETASALKRLANREARGKIIIRP